MRTYSMASSLTAVETFQRSSNNETRKMFEDVMDQNWIDTFCRYIGQGPDQDVNFIYTRSHLTEPQIYKLGFSTNISEKLR